jgi:hypothetical protein
MINKIRVMWYPLGITGLQKLYWVSILSSEKLILVQPVLVTFLRLWIFCSGLGWSYPCDIWSVGCILVELCTVCYWALFDLAMHHKYRGFELPRFCRGKHYSRLTKTWNTWLWWRGCLGLCHTICSGGQSMFMSMIRINIVLSFSVVRSGQCCVLINPCM